MQQNSRVSCQKGPTRYAYAWQIGWVSINVNDNLLPSKKQNSAKFELKYDILFQKMHQKFPSEIFWPYFPMSNAFDITIIFSHHRKLAVFHYDDVIMGAMASQITSLTIVYSTVYSGADQRKHQSSASLAFVQGIHRGPVNSPHKWPVMRKMFPFDDVIMMSGHGLISQLILGMYPQAKQD